jgi:hypothetical protein
MATAGSAGYSNAVPKTRASRLAFWAPGVRSAMMKFALPASVLDAVRW